MPASRHYLILPPGGGNIGDQAMLEAFAANVDGPVTAVQRRPGNFSDVNLPDGVRLVSAPGLIYGSTRTTNAVQAALIAMLRRARSVSVIGADIMDGAYNVRASLARWRLATRAASHGVDSRILGCSWNGTAPDEVVEAARVAGAAGVKLLLRDPASAARAIDDGIPGTHLVADLVFSAGLLDESAPRHLGLELDAPIALVNASGLVARHDNLLPDYLALVERLLDDGVQVVLLPHVARGAASDRLVLREIAEAVGKERVTLVDTLLTPAEIRGLCARTSLVVTGRMHLAIMALMSAVPAFTMSTQGKVEGLMDALGLPELCVRPETGFVSYLETAGAFDPEWRAAAAARIQEGLHTLRSLSGQNFCGLQQMVA